MSRTSIVRPAKRAILKVEVKELTAAFPQSVSRGEENEFPLAILESYRRPELIEVFAGE